VDSKTKDDLIGMSVSAGLLAVIIGACIGIGALVGSLKCSRRWGDSGMNARFRLVSGCQVEVTPGHWVPDDRVRSEN
jgi:hypothetical protein